MERSSNGRGNIELIILAVVLEILTEISSESVVQYRKNYIIKLKYRVMIKELYLLLDIINEIRKLFK